jgi:hypothetical protein
MLRKYNKNNKDITCSKLVHLNNLKLSYVIFTQIRPFAFPEGLSDLLEDVLAEQLRIHSPDIFYLVHHSGIEKMCDLSHDQNYT